ncbi:MAG: glycine cleavage system protein GcvH [Alphaproteobacteria bacterium]|nr:MAG: glycine cleavage system protein GcvH [Alphaproteobacteria bacterium]
MLKFTEDHEWLDIDGNTATVGITDYAQNALGDVVFVELPEVGATYSKGDEVAVVESVKAASEVYAPVSCEIVAVNSALEGEPGLVNTAAMDGGWFFKIKITDESELDDLMDETAYAEFIEGLE